MAKNADSTSSTELLNLIEHLNPIDETNILQNVSKLDVDKLYEELQRIHDDPSKNEYIDFQLIRKRCLVNNPNKSVSSLSRIITQSNKPNDLNSGHLVSFKNVEIHDNLDEPTTIQRNDIMYEDSGNVNQKKSENIENYIDDVFETELPKEPCPARCSFPMFDCKKKKKCNVSEDENEVIDNFVQGNSGTKSTLTGNVSVLNKNEPSTKSLILKSNLNEKLPVIDSLSVKDELSINSSILKNNPNEKLPIINNLIKDESSTCIGPLKSNQNEKLPVLVKTLNQDEADANCILDSSKDLSVIGVSRLSFELSKSGPDPSCSYKSKYAEQLQLEMKIPSSKTEDFSALNSYIATNDDMHKGTLINPNIIIPSGVDFDPSMIKVYSDSTNTVTITGLGFQPEITISPIALSMNPKDEKDSLFYLHNEYKENENKIPKLVKTISVQTDGLDFVVKCRASFCQDCQFCKCCQSNAALDAPPSNDEDSRTKSDSYFNKTGKTLSQKSQKSILKSKKSNFCACLSKPKKPSDHDLESLNISTEDLKSSSESTNKELEIEPDSIKSSIVEEDLNVIEKENNDLQTQKSLPFSTNEIINENSDVENVTSKLRNQDELLSTKVLYKKKSPCSCLKITPQKKYIDKNRASSSKNEPNISFRQMSDASMLPSLNLNYKCQYCEVGGMSDIRTENGVINFPTVIPAPLETGCTCKYYLLIPACRHIINDSQCKVHSLHGNINE